MLVCFNGHFGYVPFVNFFVKEHDRVKNKVVNISQIGANVFGIDFKYRFRFNLQLINILQVKMLDTPLAVRRQLTIVLGHGNLKSIPFSVVISLIKSIKEAQIKFRIDPTDPINWKNL